MHLSWIDNLNRTGLFDCELVGFFFFFLWGEEVPLSSAQNNHDKGVSMEVMIHGEGDTIYVLSQKFTCHYTQCHWAYGDVLDPQSKLVRLLLCDLGLLLVDVKPCSVGFNAAILPCSLEAFGRPTLQSSWTEVLWELWWQVGQFLRGDVIRVGGICCRRVLKILPWFAY